MKLLPLGVQSFADLRKKNYLYVDKTEYIHRLLSAGKPYFLSRPRRFGKSLLVSTIEEVFKGNKELFEGLYIYDKIDWEEYKHPVINVDWSKIKRDSPEEMERSLSGYLNFIATDYQMSLSSEYASDKFQELIIFLHKKFDKQVVILIDEYDMPILDALKKDDETVDGIRDFLQSFYKIIKANDEHLRFVFITGVSKFAKVSLFSGLNNPRDITLSTEYVGICGYTQHELENNFEEHIADFCAKFSRSREEAITTIRKWYNGYSWNGETLVYNPHSIILLFTERKLGNYWFSSATPAFLINILKKENDLQPILEPITVEEIAFDSFEPKNMSTIPLLFQTGYLTVKKIVEEYDALPMYTLGIPNKEVNDALLAYLLSDYSGYPAARAPVIIRRMQHELRECNATGLEKCLREMLASIPYTLHLKKEAYYHSLLLLWCKMMGFDIQGEILTNIGRIDAIWRQPEQITVIEIKYHARKKIETLLNEAMVQIEKCRYAEMFSGGKTVQLAIAFTGKNIACRIN